mmetsp:Transcript_48416/g.80238  ORF Transcript_48416/g.80238 Transcript_48416/m.80238 type:complete len:241 (+) Transcript_48416:630-1352(+)
MLDNERMHFHLARAFDKLIDFARGTMARQTTQISNQIRGFRVKQLGIVIVVIVFIPEGADIHAQHFRRLKHFAQRPHECAIHTQQRLIGHRVRFVQDTPNLVVVSFQHLDARFKLIADIQLMRIKQQQNAITAIRHPFHHFGKIVISSQALFLPRQDARGIDEGDALQNGRRHFRAMELVEEASAKLLQSPERFGTIHWHGMPRNQAFFIAMHHGKKCVRRRFRADTNARKVAPDQIADE